MPNNNNINLYLIISLISIFNKNITINDLEYSDNIDDFIKYNSEYLFETIDYIDYYLEEYNKLNELHLPHPHLISGNPYSEALIQLILDSKKRDNEVLNNILYTQKCLLAQRLYQAQIILTLLLNNKSSLDELLYIFRNKLRYDYKLRKKHVKMKLLIKK